MSTQLAAEGSLVSAQLMPLITTLVVFAVAFYVLKDQVWPRITHGLDERDRKIREEIQAAEDAREQAKAALAEYHASLGEARREAAEMIAKARGDAAAAGAALRRSNEEQLVELKDRAQRDIAAAKQAAIIEIHAEATSLASVMAGKILQREVNVDDQQRLIDESLQELGHIGA